MHERDWSQSVLEHEENQQNTNKKMLPPLSVLAKPRKSISNGKEKVFILNRVCFFWRKVAPVYFEFDYFSKFSLNPVNYKLANFIVTAFVTAHTISFLRIVEWTPRKKIQNRKKIPKKYKRRREKISILAFWKWELFYGLKKRRRKKNCWIYFSFLDVL